MVLTAQVSAKTIGDRRRLPVASNHDQDQATPADSTFLDLGEILKDEGFGTSEFQLRYVQTNNDARFFHLSSVCSMSSTRDSDL